MIVAFGTYDVAKHPRVGIIIDGLRARGFEVSEANRPLGFSTAERVRMLRQPWRLPQLGVRLLTRWWQLRGDAKRLRRDGVAADAVLVGYLGHFDVLLARRLFPGATIVLDHLIFAGDTARDRGTGGVRARLLEGLDRRAISAADIVVVDTDAHLGMLPEGTRGVVVPVGAREEWFDSALERTGGDTVDAIFFGLFTPLQGAAAMAEGVRTALDRTPRLRATIVGTGQDYDAARAALGAHERVRWLDWVEPGALPALVASHDVCLGVFGTSPKALRVVPNKVYEGAAAGCAIVTSDTPPQRAALGDAAHFARPGDADGIAAALVELADDADALQRARTSARARASRFRAEQVVAPLIDALDARP